MPNRFAVAESADGHAVFDDVGNDRDLRSLARFLSDMHWRGGRGFAKAMTKSDQLVVVQMLAANQQNKIVEKCAMHVLERRIIQRSHITAVDLRTYLRLERDDFDGVARYSLRSHELNSVADRNGFILGQSVIDRGFGSLTLAP